MSSICTICRHDISGFNTTILECNHIFHSECLIHHFRCPREWSYSHEGFGTCPLCRQGPLGGKSTSSNTTKGRIALIKRLARKNTVHPQITKSILKLKNTIKKEEEARKMYRNYGKKHGPIMKEYKRLRRQRWRSCRLVRRAETELAAFDPLAMLDIPASFIN